MWRARVPREVVRARLQPSAAHRPRPLIVLTNWVCLELQSHRRCDEGVMKSVYLRRRRSRHVQVSRRPSQTLFFCLVPVRPSPVTLSSRNGVCPAVKEDDCKTPRLVENKIPEGDLLLQVRRSCLIQTQ